MSDLKKLKNAYKTQLKEFYRIEFEEKDDALYDTKMLYIQGVLNGLGIAIELFAVDDNSNNITDELDLEVRHELKIKE